MQDLMESSLSHAIEGKSALSEFVCDANEALRFRLVRNPEDASTEATEEDFAPEMCHQVYGEQENIFGYREMSILLQMSAGSLRAFIHASWSGKIRPEDIGGLDADPVMPPIIKLLAPGQLTNNLEEFRKVVREEEPKFKPLGEKVHKWSMTSGEGDVASREFEVYKSDSSVPGFIDYHARLQPWIMFYIDAASFIDVDDPNWLFFVVYECFQLSGETRYAVAGYMTVYQYYAYPCHKRPRISQMLVLPPFQKLGLGAMLLDTAQKYFWKNDKVIDITVEDPSEDFVRLRDYVDCCNCMKLHAFREEQLRQGFSREMVQESKDTFKLCKRQARRVYEILRLKATKRSVKDEYKAYRVDVKRRLNIPFQKEERQMAKLKKVLTPEEFATSTVNLTNREQRMETLQTQYQELEEHYLRIIKRLVS